MRNYFLASLLVSLVFMGCANKKATTVDGEAAKKGDIPLVKYNLNSTISPSLIQNPPLKVAVLPPTLSEEAVKTTQEWDDVDAPGLFRTVFFGRFSVLPYKDVSIKDVDQILAQNGISASSIDQVPAEQLANLLNVDTLIYLHLTEVENVNAGVHGRTEYAVTLTMKSVPSNRELWKAELKQNIFGGLLSSKSSQVGAFIEFEKINRNRPLAFRKVAEAWSHRVISDLKEKLNETN